MTRRPSETQATPSDPASEGPTDCVHCGQRIRRFGQTRRWCHDVTGNVQCKRGGVSGDVHPEGPGFSREARAHTRSDHPHRAPAEDEAAVERHSYAVHPAALILADHYIARNNSIRGPSAPIRCDCDWTGPTCDHPAHLAEMLQQAGLLTDGTPPVTPTTRVLAERADRTAPCCNAHHFEGCADGEPGCCPRCSINPWPTERTDGRTT